MLPTQDLKARMDAAVAEKDLLTHPFYEAWSAGELTLDDLKLYAGQYWRQVEAFPSYLRALESKSSGDTRTIVQENLSDEVDGEHDELWLRFAAAVGADRTEVAATAPLAETNECVDAFRSGTDSRDLAFGLGMLYGYESQTPRVADAKVAGLAEHYGITGEGAAYFSLHATLDVEHSGDLAAAIEREVGEDPELSEQAVAGARAGAAGVWRLLDGVERVRTTA